MTMIRVWNDGPRLVSTNYWETEGARQGLFYLTSNAGAFRLLVPLAAEKMLREVRNARYVVVTRGRWQGHDALELLFEDETEAPYSIHLLAEWCDRLPARSDEGRTDLRFLIYTKAGLQQEFPARYRRTALLPYLAPWAE